MGSKPEEELAPLIPTTAQACQCQCHCHCKCHCCNKEPELEEEQETLVTVDEGYKISVDASDKASEINRQLAFAGIAIIWVFKIDAGGGRQIVPYDLFLPGLLLVIGLGLDLLHYVLKSEIWYRLTRMHEKVETLKFDVAPWINYPGDTLYWLKIIATVSAYLLLVRFLLRQLF